MKNNNHHNVYSFDCSTAVFIRVEMQNYNFSLREIMPDWCNTIQCCGYQYDKHSIKKFAEKLHILYSQTTNMFKKGEFSIAHKMNFIMGLSQDSLVSTPLFSQSPSIHQTTLMDQNRIRDGAKMPSAKIQRSGGGIETKHTVTHFATCEPIIAVPSGILAENGLQVIGKNARINKIMRVSTQWPN